MRLLRSQILLTLVTGLLLVLPITASADVIDSLNNTAQNLVYNIVIGILGMLVWLSALLLDFGVNSFVIGFGEAFVNTGIGVAVDNTWVIVRDFVNLFFIFGFVYIGFKMILNSSDSNTRRWLVNIILAALLVNFSLFITKFAIDVSNQLAAQIAVNGLGSTGGVDASTGLAQVDLSSEFMARLGLAKVLSLKWEDINGAGWGYVFGSAILFLTAAFVFAAGGILLIMRFAILNLFMVLSPVMFMSWVLPPLKDTFERFWSMLIGRALFAPIYLLFLYFSLQIISGLQVSVGRGGNGFAKPEWAGTFQAVDNVAGGASTGTLGTFPFFILICGFLALSIIAANKLGMDGGSKAVSMGKSFGNKIRKTAVNNSAGFAARGVNRLSESTQGFYEKTDARMSQSKLGRFTRGTISAVSLGALSDKNIKGTLGAGRNLRIDGSETASDVDKRKQERQKLQNKTNDERARANDFAINHEIGEDVNGVFTAQQREDARSKMAAIIKNMSDDELKKLSIKQLQANTVAGHLSDAQIKMLKESGQYSNDDIKSLKSFRDTATFSQTDSIFADVNSSAADLDSAFESLGKTIKGLSEERLQNMDFARLSDEKFASNLSDSQMESLQKSGKLTNQQMQQVRTARETGIRGTIDGTITGRYANSNQQLTDKLKQRLFSRSTDEIGKMPISIFKDAQSFTNITPAMLEARIKNGISGPDSTDVRNALLQHLNVGQAAQIPPNNMWGKWKSSNSTFAAQFFS